MADADAIIVGGGLAGLAAAAELGDAGKRVIIVEQEGGGFLGGQAFWSLGGLFLVNTPEQRRLRIKDSRDLAWQDWLGSAQFDRPEDHWPRKVAEAYVDFAAGEMRPWLHGMGMRWWPVVGWAERGGALANGHGNSVPRFHLTWGTGPGVVAPFERRVREHVAKGLITLKFRHQVSRLIKTNGAVTGVAGEILEASNVERGKQSNRTVIGDFELSAGAVIVTSGGIGGNHDLVRKVWPVERLGPAPKRMVAGVPHHVDGRMVAITQDAGGAVINADRMWHYVEGLKNWNPIWPNHGIRVLSAPSPLWFDALGRTHGGAVLPELRFARHAEAHPVDRPRLFLVRADQDDRLEGVRAVGLRAEPRLHRQGLAGGAEEPARRQGAAIGGGVPGKGRGLRRPRQSGRPGRGHERALRRQSARLRPAQGARSWRAIARSTMPTRKDAQVTAIRGARNYIGDKIFRVTKPHKILDPEHGPLIAIRLNILTRKTLGGLHTNLNSQVLDGNGEPIAGLYAAGEVAGGGGGGYHGYNALEGTFLGSCIFSGRNAGRHAAGR